MNIESTPNRLHTRPRKQTKSPCRHELLPHREILADDAALVSPSRLLSATKHYDTSAALHLFVLFTSQAPVTIASTGIPSCKNHTVPLCFKLSCPKL